MYTNNQITDRVENSKLKKFFSGPKIIFIILGIVVLAEVIYAARTLVSPAPAVPARQSPAQAGTVGKISLITPKASVKLNEAIPVTVMVDTGGHTIDGVDLIVQYDPKILEVTTGNLTKGQILDEYPLMSVDASKGLISVSGINRSGNGFSGSGQFAVINLRAKQKGKTSLTIDFKQGSTTDSNLVERNTSKNILEQVDNLEMVVE